MHRYAVSSLLDTMYALLEQYLDISSFNLQNAKSVVYVLNTPILEDGENATMKQIRRNKWEKTTMFAEAKYMAKDASSKKFLQLKESQSERQDSDKPKGNNVVGPSVVNKVEHNKSTRAVVRLPDPKLKTLGERGIECIFQPEPESELRKSKRNGTPKNFGLEFQLYLIKGTRDEVSDQHSYYFNVEDDPKTFDEMNSIMGNNTWVLVDLPPGCKWIFKRKLKGDGTIEKFKARLVI
ncbi:zinc finger, CCHC-type containing protein [Tanacetum coccineum]